MKKALISDLDMTLLDSKRDIAIGVAHAVSEVSGKIVTEQDVLPWLGKGLMVMFGKMMPGAGKDVFFEVVKVFQRFFWDRCNIHTQPFPGVMETLKTLKENGIPIAVASNKMSFIARRVVRMNLLEPYILFTRGPDDLPGKPDPAVILACLETIEAGPDSTVYVGDSVADVRSGKASGCFTVAVSYGLNSAEELKAENPDMLIDSFSEIFPLFE